MKPLVSLINPTEIVASKLALDTPITSLTNRSDEVSPGACFFALVGHQSDGHRFLADALAKGAGAVIVERREAFEAHNRAVLVNSTRHVLGCAASRWHGEPSRHFKLVGVTGTNGKTTTTFLLKNIWDALGLTNGVVGTVEYHIGTKRRPSPLTTPDPLLLQELFAQMVAERVGHVAAEVSSIALDQSRTTGSVFETAIFTNLTQDHLDYHGDMERYFQAKRRLFDESRPRWSVFNIDDPYGRKLFQSHLGQKFSFSMTDANADFFAHSVVFEKGSSRAEIATPAGAFPLLSGLIGKHNLYNALGVVAASYSLGHDLCAVMKALRTADGAPGRLERVRGEAGKHPHVFVDYAHTDDALRNVLSSLHELRAGSPGRIVTVFGCGGDRDRGKRPLMARVASTFSDITIATSDNPRTEDPQGILDDIEVGILREKTQYHREVDRAVAIETALRLATPDDLVLVAGKGHETYQILGRDRVAFDDREIVRRFFAKS